MTETAIGAGTSVVCPLDESLFQERSDMELICNNLKNLDSLRDKGLIPQLYAIRKIIVEIMQEKIGSRKDKVIVEELKKLSVCFGTSKVSEAKRFYKLCCRFLQNFWFYCGGADAGCPAY